MNEDQLVAAIARAVEAAKPAQEYCFLWINWWATCMTKAEWSGWMQAIGAIIGLITAITLPFFLRWLEKREVTKRAWDESDLTIRLHSSLLVTNEQLLRVALGNMPGAKGEGHPGNDAEVRLAIDALTPVSFDNILRIGIADPVLAKHLADFHTQLDLLVGVLQRNPGPSLSMLEKTVKKYLDELDQITNGIRMRTVVPS